MSGEWLNCGEKEDVAACPVCFTEGVLEYDAGGGNIRSTECDRCDGRGFIPMECLSDKERAELQVLEDESNLRKNNIVGGA